MRADDAQWILHPLLIALFPVLFLASHNVGRIPLSSIPGPLLFVVAAAMITWLVAGMLLRSKTKGALVSSATVIMLLFYKYAHGMLEQLTGWQPRHRYTLLAWVVLYLTLVIRIGVARTDLRGTTRAANLYFGVLVLMSLATLGYNLSSSDQFRSFRTGSEAISDLELEKEIAAWTLPEEEYPDIYYLILDGYGRADMLEASYGFDNQEFLGELEDLGFFLAKGSAANYPSTVPSLRSSLNIDYLPDAAAAVSAFSIESNKIARILKILGYKYLFVPSGYYITNRSSIADMILDSGASVRIDELTVALIEGSALWFAFKIPNWSRAIRRMYFRDPSDVEKWRVHVIRSIELVGEVSELTGPKFVFAHVISPHGPFVFNRDGSLNENSKISDFSNAEDQNIWLSPGVVDQLIYLNTILRAMISRILKSSTQPPIIILQGDHGTFALIGADRQADASEEAIRERASILFAILGSQNLRSRFYHSISPVNIFRIIFNDQFGADYPILPDRTYWTYTTPPLDVTSIVAPVKLPGPNEGET